MKKKTVQLFSLAFLVVLLFASYPVAANDTVTLTYKINKANSGIITWYDAAWQPTNYTFDNVATISISVANVFNYSSTMNVTIGDIAFVNVSDEVVDSNLALGYWNLTYNFGIVAATTWSDLDTINPTDVGLNSFAKNESTFTVIEDGINYNYKVVNVFFADSYQSTYLTYDKVSGLLVHAQSIFFGYLLDITLVNGGQLGFGTTSEATPFSFTFVIAVFSLTAIKMIRKHEQ